MFKFFWAAIIGFFKKLPSLEEWFVVEFDDEFIYRDVAPPNGQAYKDKFRWADIQRICFKCEGPYSSDELYFFTNQREASYVIPMEAKNADKLWFCVIEKGLFDEQLAIQAMGSASGVFCFPKIDD